MTLKVKSIIISILIALLIGISYRLSVEYNYLSNAIIEHHSLMEKVLGSKGSIYKSFVAGKSDPVEAKAVVDIIVGDLKRIRTEELTQQEIDYILSIRMSFISIKDFVYSFKNRAEHEMTLKSRIQILIFITVIIGLLMLSFCFYKSFLEPINHLTYQIALVKDGKASNIIVSPGDDEIAKFSDFTYQTLEELHKSNDSLSRRLEMQSALSAILHEAQKIEEMDFFLSLIYLFNKLAKSKR